MTDKRKPEELSTDDLDQAVGGVASSASGNPEGFKAGATLANPVKKKKAITLPDAQEVKDGETKEFASSAGGSPNV